MIARGDIRKSQKEARGTVRHLGIVSPDQNLRYVPTRVRLRLSHPRKLFLEGTYEGAHEEVIGL